VHLRIALAALTALALIGAMPPPIPRASPIAISGTGDDAYLDGLVVAFMQKARVANAQLAVSKNGVTVFSHAYTYQGIAASITTTSTIMRLASNTKAWTSAALYNLIASGAVDPKAKVFAYLGITQPLPAGAHVDPRVYEITIEDMIQHKSGWDDSKPPYYDPSFAMRETALALGLTHEIDQTQYVRYQLHQPLQEAPGQKYAYCNFCYDVLGMVVAKASGMRYIDYVQAHVAAPSGAALIDISPTVGSRLRGEVAQYYNTKRGLSAVYVTSKQLWPFPYGGNGGLNEVGQGDGGAATSAESMLALMNHYIIWGVGTPPPKGEGWAREGEMSGTETYAEQAPNRTNWAFDINTDQHVARAFDKLQSTIEKYLYGACYAAC
jgi:CubicO group peptidase (beta-lactamase class C family)